MKVIITSGGTAEKIDDVRTITNVSTGKLGSLIAHAFYTAIPSIEIIYICSNNAILPDIPCTIMKINSAMELKCTIENILNNEKIDAVVHSMAVSDYYVSGISSLDKIISRISTVIHENKELLETTDSISSIIKSEIAKNEDYPKKISSNVDNLMLFMAKTPKVISVVKKIQPKTILVGFKLLVDVSEEQLLEIGHNLLIRNECDFVLANDLNNITAHHHNGILIKPDSSYIYLQSKEEIARAIVQNIIMKIRGEGD